MALQFLLVFIGIPSVGKTTFAKKLAKKFKEEGYQIIIIGSDDIRNMIPDYNEDFDPKLEPIIREMTQNLIKTGLKHGFNVINDDLNYYKSMRHDLFEIAKENNCLFFLIYFKIPLEIALKRNEKRGLPIPNSVIKNIYEKLDDPGEYSWDEPIFTFESLNFIEPNEINKLFSKITSAVDDLKQNKKLKTKSKSGKPESLDKITRSLIHELVSKQNHKRFSKELSLLRKKILIKAKEENLSLEQVKILFSRQITDFLIKNQPVE
ncbi:MAG: AAA family ATPase [Candidatus Helarchaeota archaeon]